jgi:hypothetical protein
MSEETYLRVQWRHDLPDEPIELWSELDANRREVRKIEVWKDGRVGTASASHSSDGTHLGEVPVPAANAIAADSQFDVEQISSSEFEGRWSQTVS